MYWEFEGGIKLTDQENKGKIEFYETKWCVVKRWNELNNINNDDLANTAIECYNIS